MSRSTMGSCFPPRRILMLLALVVCLFLLVRQLPAVTSARLLQTDDYVEYWAAGRLNLTGANPYAPEQLAPLQNGAGRFFQAPVMMWNPPPTLAIAMPLALLPYPVSRSAWLLLNVVVLALCADVTWRVYEGPSHYRWLAWLICFASVPTLSAFQSGQISILVFAGAVGFLVCQRSGRSWQAGALAALTALKPHVLYLFWVVLLLWAADRRQRQVLLAAVGALLGGTAIALVFNPALIGQYLDAVAAFPPLDSATPTTGGFLRLVFGPEKRWLQFAAAPVGLAWAAWWWQKHRVHWDWSERLPLLIAVSLVTAAYGWSFDLVAFLLPAVQVAVWLTRSRNVRATAAILGGYAAITGLSVALHGRVYELWFMWLAPALLLWYLAAAGLLRGDQRRGAEAAASPSPSGA